MQQQQELRIQQSPARAPAAPAWCQTSVLTEQEQQQPGRGICAAGTDRGGREAGLGVATQKGEKKHQRQRNLKGIEANPCFENVGHPELGFVGFSHIFSLLVFSLSQAWEQK